MIKVITNVNHVACRHDVLQTALEVLKFYNDNNADTRLETYDPEIAIKCENMGFEVLPCVDENYVNFWMIFPEGGESRYFDNVYSK